MSRTFRLRHKNRRCHRSMITSHSIEHINAATKIVDHYGMALTHGRRKLVNTIISLITDKSCVHDMPGIRGTPGILSLTDDEAIKYGLGVQPSSYLRTLLRTTYTSFVTHDIESLIHHLDRHRVYEISWCVCTDRDVFGPASFRKEKKGIKLYNKYRLKVAIASKHYDEL